MPAHLMHDGQLLELNLRSWHDLEAQHEGERIPVWFNEVGGPEIESGTSLVLLVPRYIGLLAGLPQYDFTHTTAVPVYVAGNYRLETGVEASLYNSRHALQTDAEGRTIRVPVYWDRAEVFFWVSDTRRIFSFLDGGDPGLPPAYQLGVDVENVFYTRSVAERLQQLLTDRTVLPVARQVELMAHRVRAVEQDDGSLRYERTPSRHAVLPANLYPAFVGLAFLLAGMLLMANMNILVTERRVDLGILRSLGMSSGEIIALILSETTIISLTGAGLGLVLFLPLLVLLLVNTDVGVQVLAGELLLGYGAVLAAAVLVGIVFGAFPAWRAARETVAELLR
jgi:hypothetical protein